MAGYTNLYKSGKFGENLLHRRDMKYATTTEEVIK